MFGRNEYHISSNKLEYTAHPVTWLRILLLADRVKQMGDNLNAENLEETWKCIAENMGIVEDYYGYYEPDFLPLIQQTIDDMLTEAEPYNYRCSEKEMNLQNNQTPIHLLNQAWDKFYKDPEKYFFGEKTTISKFLKS